MNKGLTAEDFLFSFPYPLATQKNISALAEIFTQQMEALAKKARELLIFPQIDTAPERLLDILAKDFNLEWYDSEQSLSAKRNQIRNAIFTYRHLGTNGAVQRLITSLFSEGYIREWTDYGGKPYHYKIYTVNPNITVGDTEKFLSLSNTVKRCSAVCDEVVLLLDTEPLNVRMGMRVCVGDTVRLGAADFIR